MYAVIILTLFAAGILSFFLATGIQQIQEAINPQLSEDKWASEDHYDTFALAATFVNYIWVYIVVFVVLGLAYYGWTEAQRRQNY